MQASIPDASLFNAYNNAEMCESITSRDPDDVSYIVYSEFNKQQIVHYNEAKTTKSSYGRRKRREDHSTDPNHPAFDGRIIGGTVANIKRNLSKLFFGLIVFFQNFHFSLLFGSITDMPVADRSSLRTRLKSLNLISTVDIPQHRLFCIIGPT